VNRSSAPVGHRRADAIVRRGRVQALALLVLAGALISFVGPQQSTLQGAAGRPGADLASHARGQREREVRARFEQGVSMLHARRYEHAITALERVLALQPRLPEAQVNLGFAWLGLRDAAQAQRAFETAIAWRPTQANAYYGLAMALEQRGDPAAARGAMRSYLHLSRADDPYRPRARAALWEWESSQPGRPAAPTAGPRVPARDTAAGASPR
jgi:tetratricopeptide (TPR) repeat protein